MPKPGTIWAQNENKDVKTKIENHASAMPSLLNIRGQSKKSANRSKKVCLTTSQLKKIINGGQYGTLRCSGEFHGSGNTGS